MFGQMSYPFGTTAFSNVPNTLVGQNGLTKGLGLFSKINWSSFLTNTQKVLSVANQAIPLYHQAKPVIQNIRALGKIGKEFSKININEKITNNNNIETYKTKQNKALTPNTNEIPTPIFFH